MTDENREQEKGVIVLLRICTVLLAAVSFWSTANGMSEYTFPEGWQAYAASLGIQGVLLGLNFSLSSFLRKSKKFLQKVSLLFLTFIVLFCSSWFSYLYIARQAYGTSWTIESQLLAQEVYREELFSANAFSEKYTDELQQILANQLIELYRQAAEMDENTIDVSRNLIWAEEREEYGDSEFAARDSMLTVIDAMEQATQENAPQTIREQAVSTLTGIQSSLTAEIDRINIEIEKAKKDVSEANARVSEANAILREAQRTGVGIQNFTIIVENASANYQRQMVNLDELNKEHDDYQKASRRTAYYAAILGLEQEGVSSYYVGSDLREIQTELFQPSPDLEKMIQLSLNVFDRLQDAIDMGTNTKNNLNYQDFLVSMNRFIQNLENYRSIKDINDRFHQQISTLADGNILILDSTGSAAEDESDNKLGSNEWKSEWQEQFNKLVSQISSLPVYTYTSESTANNDLGSYSKIESVQKLDDTIRRYLTDHNAAQKGIIYLISPHREIALFALFLAFLLDIAAFVTGAIIDRASRESSIKTEENSDIMYEQQIEKHMDDEEKCVVKTLNRYLFLTGDYTYMDGTLTYKAIENGLETFIEYPEHGLQSGFYIWYKGKIQPVKASELLYKGVSENIQDGVYENSIIRYNDGLLTITVSDNSSKNIFLGSVEAYIPVYRISADTYEALPAKDADKVHGKKIVVSLNQDGTQIVALYVVLQ